MCVLGLFLTKAHAQTSFVLPDFLNSVVNGGTYETNEAVAFFDIMGQNQCFGSDTALYDIALSCLSEAATISTTNTCPSRCSNFYVTLAQNCPGVFEGVDIPLPYASGSVADTLASICQGGTNPGTSPPSNGDEVPIPPSCEAHFNQGVPAECDQAISLSLSTGDETCPSSCVPLWSTFPEQCKTDLYALYAQYPGYLESEIASTAPGYHGCLALALPDLFSGGLSPGTSPPVAPPDDGTGPDINEVETDGPAGPDIPGNNTIPSNSTSPPPSTTLSPPPSTNTNTTSIVLQVNAADVPACASAISTGVLQANIDSCLAAIQTSGTPCPTPCQQLLDGLTDQCKAEINAVADQQNVALDLFILGSLCKVVGASIRTSAVHVVTLAVALALGQFA